MLLNLLRNNFGLKALAFGLALAAWAYFHLAAAPGLTAHFDQTLNVPIVTSGLSAGFDARFAEKFATVTVELPRNSGVIKADQVQAILDLSDVTEPGVRNVAVKLVAPDLTVRSLSPASVIVAVDRLEERVVPVSIQYVGEHSGTVVDSTAIDPPQTTIRGTAADLARVSTVRVQLPFPNRAQQFDAMLRPAPAGADGVELGDVEVSPNLVRVRAKFIAPTASIPTPKHT